MKRVLSILVTLTLALWAGSLIHTMLIVSSLFTAFPKASSTVALEAAPRVFFVSERYHIALAVIAMVSLIVWRTVSCSRSKRWMMVLTLTATALAFVQTFGISARMDALRGQGLSGGPEFNKLHRLSTTEYIVQTVLVIGALALLPAASASSRDLCATDKSP